MLGSNRTTVPTMQAADAAVLRLFYEATGGAAWFNRSGWHSDPVSCVAAGVTCGDGGAVVGLSFSLARTPFDSAWPTYNLSGTLPTQLGRLTELRKLNLDGGRVDVGQGFIGPLGSLTGGVPTEVGSLTALTELSLINNRLSGTLPTQLGRLTALVRHFSVEVNALSGTIPTQIGQWASMGDVSPRHPFYYWMGYMTLRQNSLSGTIPTQIGRLTNLRHAWFSQNSLTGTLPTELGNTDLRHLWFYEVGSLRYLSGTVPTQIGRIHNLDTLAMLDSSLSGTLPTEFFSLTRMKLAVIQWSYLSGTIPTVRTS